MGITLSVVPSGIIQCQSPLQNCLWLGEFSGFAAILEDLSQGKGCYSLLQTLFIRSISTDLVKCFLGGGAEFQALINEEIEISLTNVCWDFSTKFCGNNRPL